MHRMANVNEYSTRYSIAIDAAEMTAPDEWRLQAVDNKQGSSGYITQWPAGYTLVDDYMPGALPDEDGKQPRVLDPQGRPVCKVMSPGQYLSMTEDELQRRARAIYAERIAMGISREQARKDLPLSTYTEAYWKIDLKNLLNFLSLRMDSHAQEEIREYAGAIYDIVRQVCPLAVKAFNLYDQRRGGLLLSKHECDLVHMLRNNRDFDAAVAILGIWPPPPAKSRERDEARDKMMRLGLV